MPTQCKISNELHGRHKILKKKTSAPLHLLLFFSVNRMKLVGVSLEYSEAQLSACCICWVSQMTVENYVKHYAPQAMS